MATTERTRSTQDCRTVRQTDDQGITRREAVRRTLATTHGHGPSVCESRATSHEAHASLPCCADCVYAVALQDESRPLLVCTGCPQCPGRMRVTKETDCCRSFTRKRRQSGRTVPPEPPDDGIRYVPLTKGKFAIVDAADYERVARFKWCASVSGSRTYAYCHMKGKTVALHRFLTDAPPGLVVDHIDGNGLNDRQSNLRVCTQRQNLYNSRPKGRHSHYKGVCWDKGKNRWAVYVRYEGRNIFVGRFRDEVEAARAYDRKAYECFGEYAYLNFPYEIKERGGE